MSATSRQPTVSPKKNRSMGLAVRSSRSNPGSGLWPSILVWSVIAHSLRLVRRFQNFDRENVIRRNQRHRTQITEKVRQPKAAHGNRDNDVQPGQVEGD